MKYCSQCGAKVELRIPEGDTLPRYVCNACRTIHYSNPKLVVGCIPEWEDKILLCKRAIEPRQGLWTLPAGFLENDETTVEGAARETFEETLSKVEVTDLYALFNLPHINQVYVMFRGNLLGLDFGPTPESEVVELYVEKDIPWDRIAFPVIEQTLKLYFQDKNRGEFSIHTGDIVRLPGNGRKYKVKLHSNR